MILCKGNGSGFYEVICLWNIIQILGITKFLDCAYHLVFWTESIVSEAWYLSFLRAKGGKALTELSALWRASHNLGSILIYFWKENLVGDAELWTWRRKQIHLSNYCAPFRILHGRLLSVTYNPRNSILFSYLNRFAVWNTHISTLKLIAFLHSVLLLYLPN